MKKIAFVLLTLCMAAGIVMAQDDDGLGLYVGAETFIMDLSELSDTMGVRGYVGIETSFDALDVYAEAGLDIPMNDAFIGLDLNGGVNYNISFSDVSKLKFGGGLWIFFPFDDEKGTFTNVSPYGSVAIDMVNKLLSIFGAFISYDNDLSIHTNFNVTFTQTMGFGDLYFGIDMPFLLFADYVDAFDIAEFNFTAGVDLEMGVGAGFTLYNWIGDKSFIDDFVTNIDIFGTYENGPLFVGLTIGIPLMADGIDYLGFIVTPEAAYTLDFGLTIYAEMPISGLGSKKYEILGTKYGGSTIGLTVGVKYSF